MKIKNPLDRYLLGDEWDLMNVAGQIKLLVKNREELIDEALSIGGVLFSMPRIIVDVLENPAKENVLFYEDFVHIISIPSAYNALITSKIREDFLKLHYREDIEALKKIISEFENKYIEFLEVLDFSSIVDSYRKVYDAVEINIIGKLLNPETCIYTFKILAKKLNAEKTLTKRFTEIFSNIVDIIENYMKKREFDEKTIKKVLTILNANV